MLSQFSCVRLFATLWTVVCQAPLSMGFSRQEYWRGLPCPPPGDIHNPGIKASFFMSKFFLSCYKTWISFHKMKREKRWKSSKLVASFTNCFRIRWASSLAQRLKRLPGMRETWVRSLGGEDPLEKEMATHSSTLAWRIPWREEPGRLQSMGSQRAGHDWVTSLHLIVDILNIQHNLL